jgi:hypothetical protein
MLARQPLFQLLGSIIVLLVTDYMPAAGAIAFVIWATWIYMSISKKSSAKVDGQGEAANRNSLYGSAT